MSASITAACGRPTTPAAPGTPSSTISRPAPSAPSRWRRRTPTPLRRQRRGIAATRSSVGDGMYRSRDGGKTWRHLGLRDGQQIPAIWSTPQSRPPLRRRPWATPTGPTPERGVLPLYRWRRELQRVLYKDDRTGAVDLAFDPTAPRMVYAVLWQAQQGPWENGAFSAGPTADFSNPPTAATIGPSSPADCPRSSRGSAASASASRQRSATACTRWWKPRRARGRAACSGRSLSLRRCRRHLDPGQQRKSGLRARPDFACVRVDPE
jgi:hypothetical protein